MLTMGRRRYRSPQQMAAPILQPLTPQEEGTGGCRRGAEIRVRPAALGARRSQEVCPESRPRASGAPAHAKWQHLAPRW